MHLRILAVRVAQLWEPPIVNTCLCQQLWQRTTIFFWVKCINTAISAPWLGPYVTDQLNTVLCKEGYEVLRTTSAIAYGVEQGHGDTPWCKRPSHLLVTPGTRGLLHSFWGKSVQNP